MNKPYTLYRVQFGEDGADSPGGLWQLSAACPGLRSPCPLSEDGPPFL